MATTQNTYTGNGSNKLFSITFPYLETSDIDVYLNNVLQTITTQYSFANATTIEFVTAPPNGATVKIDRSTDDSELSATFFPGSSIKASDLNDNFDQTLYVVQEINNNAVKLADPLYVNKTYIDAADATKVNKSGDTMTGNLAMSGNLVTGLGTPSSDADSATKKYVDDRYGQLSVPGVTRWRKTATAGQTTFSGAGEYGGTLAYSSSRETVYVNGALQQRNVDYTADNGTSIVFTPALLLGDVVEIHCVNNAAGVTTDQSSGIYWLQSGTGALTRTVDSKLKDVLSVKDFGAVGDGVTDDTAAIQAAIDYAGAYNPATLVFPGGGYAVTEIFFDNFYTTYRFDQAQIVPYGTTSVDALVHITNREQTFYGMQINGNYQTHFTAALRIHSVSGSGYWPGFVRMYDLNILSAKIGILYGAFTSPVDAPVSENTIDGYTTRGVERPIYLNQPNGFLNLTNSVLDCGAAEDPTWNATTACCIENVQCILKVSNSQFNKVASGAGYGIKNSSALNISNCDAEIASTHFLLNNGSATFIDNWHTYFWSSSTIWFFESASNATAKLFVNNLNYTKAASSAGAGNGLLKTNGTTGLVAYFSNCLFSNQVGDALLTSDFRSRWTDADVQFSNCYVENTSGSKFLPISTTENVARYYNLPATAKYNLTVGAPATITVGAVNQPDCKNALIFTGSAGTNCMASTKVGIDQSIQVDKKFYKVTVGMSASATNPNVFQANFYVTYYDNAGNILGYQQLGEGDGAVGHIQAVSGDQAWREISRILDVPLLCSEIQLTFSLNTTAVWRVGNISIS